MAILEGTTWLTRSIRFEMSPVPSGIVGVDSTLYKVSIRTVESGLLFEQTYSVEGWQDCHSWTYYIGTMLQGGEVVTSSSIDIGSRSMPAALSDNCDWLFVTVYSPMKRERNSLRLDVFVREEREVSERESFLRFVLIARPSAVADFGSQLLREISLCSPQWAKETGRV